MDTDWQFLYWLSYSEFPSNISQKTIIDVVHFISATHLVYLYTSWLQLWNFNDGGWVSLDYLLHGYCDVIFSCMLIFCSTDPFNFTCFFMWSSHFFCFFFFCSQKYNKKLWNWVLINLGPVSNCPFSACLYGFVHVCQFVCPCLRLWTCHAPSPRLYSNNNKKHSFPYYNHSCIQCYFWHLA